jgi:DUF1365 family protein
MSAKTSAIYVGEVGHHRLRPLRHALRYRMFWLLLDLDELDELGLRLLKRNAPAPLSFRDADHLDGSDVPLKLQVEALLAQAGIEPGGAIHLLCMPRIFGYVFNPLSVYLCHGRDGGLSAVLYEVNNTFGQRHCYLLPVEPGAQHPIRQSCDKRFHVSPFMEMALRYEFLISPPEEGVSVAVNAFDDAGPVIRTYFRGRRRSLTDAALLRVLLTHPLLTMKVMAAIHLEAAKLWLKGARFHRAPAPPEAFTTVAQPLGARTERSRANL